MAFIGAYPYDNPPGLIPVAVCKGRFSLPIENGIG